MLHSFGITLFIFRVLAAFNSLYALGLLFAIGIVPSIVKLVFTQRMNRSSKDKSNRSTSRVILTIVFDVLSTLCQLGSIGVSFYLLLSQYQSTYNWKTKPNIRTSPLHSSIYWQVEMNKPSRYRPTCCMKFLLKKFRKYIFCWSTFYKLYENHKCLHTLSVAVYLKALKLRFMQMFDTASAHELYILL